MRKISHVSHAMPFYLAWKKSEEKHKGQSRLLSGGGVVEWYLKIEQLIVDMTVISIF